MRLYCASKTSHFEPLLSNERIGRVEHYVALVWEGFTLWVCILFGVYVFLRGVWCITLFRHTDAVKNCKRFRTFDLIHSHQKKGVLRSSTSWILSNYIFGSSMQLAKILMFALLFLTVSVCCMLHQKHTCDYGYYIQLI